MYRIATDKTERIIDKRLEFERVYIGLMRNKITARGYEAKKGLQEVEIFSLENGVETSALRRRYFTQDPYNWKPVPPELVCGILAHIKSLAALSRYMGITTNTIQNWKKKGITEFYIWSYIAGLLGINLEKSAYGIEVSDLVLPYAD